MENVDILYTSLVALLLLLQALDIHSTHTALVKINGLQEANPFVKASMDRFGVIGGLFAIKVPFLVLLYTFGSPSWFMNGVLLVLCAFYIAIVSNNYRLIKKHG